MARHFNKTTVFVKAPLSMEGKQKYECSFKRKTSGKLLWAFGYFNDENEATKELNAYVQVKHQNKGYLLYGGSMLAKN